MPPGAPSGRPPGGRRPQPIVEGDRMSLSEATRSKLASLIASDRVVLFMKGNRAAPQCGFSARVVQILDSLLPKYATVDVLREPDVREGIKEFSSWPTIPQLYIDGEFLGGCDIVTELYSTGELKRKLEGATAR
jgi:monothiol glutaredoxin